jgi:curved DNA-binding protein CbpA
MDSRHGNAFLIDFYAVLGVERTADGETITKAYRQKQLHYHPDRYEGLAHEFKSQAAERSGLIAEIYAILNDPEKKQTYDAQLASWQGAISTDGYPVIDFSKPYFSPEGVFGREPDAKRREVTDKLIDSLAGFDSNTFTLVEQMFIASANPSPEIRRAYLEQLEKRDLFLSLRESFAWEEAGFHNQPTTERVTLDYHEHVEAQISEAGKKFGETVSKTLLMISTGEIKLLGTQGEAIATEITADPSQALALYQQRATERFTQVTGSVRHIATKRAELTQKRVDAIKAEYNPPQEKMFPFLAICMKPPNGKLWQCFYYDGESVTVHPDITSDELERLEDPAAAEEWIAKGRNILYFSIQNSIEYLDQLRELVMRHFDPLVNAEEEKE